MNIDRADYATVVMFGSLQDLQVKLQKEGKTLDEVIDVLDERGVSLLEHCLAFQKFDIAEYLLQNNAKVNNVTKEGYNEFHIIAAGIRYMEIPSFLLCVWRYLKFVPMKH